MTLNAKLADFLKNMTAEEEQNPTSKARIIASHYQEIEKAIQLNITHSKILDGINATLEEFQREKMTLKTFRTILARERKRHKSERNTETLQESRAISSSGDSIETQSTRFDSKVEDDISQKISESAISSVQEKKKKFEWPPKEDPKALW